MLNIIENELGLTKLLQKQNGAIFWPHYCYASGHIFQSCFNDGEKTDKNW